MKKTKLTLLIVDDNSFFIERLISLLDETERIDRIEAAYNYDQAIACLEKAVPDVVLLDINLPGKNGIALLQEIKKANKKCVTIMISNHNNEYYREKCKKLGADHFLDKSSDFGMLPAIINGID